MTFLPIVERELRVRARLRSTWWFRLGAAGLAIGLVGVLLLMAEGFAAPGAFGPVMFLPLAWGAFGYCLLEGARNTADCLSEEKRQGTLGLLFLTDLKGYDVVLGKLMATSLNSFYGLLAIFPPLAIPIVIGGVAAGEFWRLVLALIVILFFSLNVGLFVSALGRNAHRVWIGTLGSLLAIATGPPLAQWLAGLAGFTPGWPVDACAWFSPLSLLLALFDARYAADPGAYWNGIRAIHGLSWLLLFAASFLLPRVWQDRPVRRRANWFERLSGPSRMRRNRRWMLDINPALWLARRPAGQSALLWILVGTVCALGVVVWAMNAGNRGVAWGLFGLAVLMHFGLAILLASEACHAMADARDSGALELLLSTPLTARQIVEGHLLALKELFFRPVALLVSVEILLSLLQLVIHWKPTLNPGAYVLHGVISAFLGLSFVLDLMAVAHYGLWMGLRSKKSSQAVTKTILFVLVLPLALAPCAGPLYVFVAIVKDLIFMNYAREQIKRYFRPIVAERYGHGTADAAIPGTAPSRRASLALPPVLPR